MYIKPLVAHYLSHKPPASQQRFDIRQSTSIVVDNPPNAGRWRRTLAITRSPQPTYFRLRKYAIGRMS
jgi:hypothetical protein